MRVCAMEAVLDVYERPYNEEQPVIGLDESPQQLISEVRASFTDSKGVIYQDFEYKRWWCRRLGYGLRTIDGKARNLRP